MSFNELNFLRITRKIAPAIFLALFVLPVTSTYFLFKIRQSNIHRNIRDFIENGLTDSELVLLKIPLSVEIQSETFESTEENEFKYKGNMFDVVRSERHQDTTWYWCVWDKDETALEEALQNAKRRASSGEDNNPDDIMSSFLKMLFIDTTEATSIPTIKPNVTYSYFYLIDKLNSPFTPPSPPPKLTVLLMFYSFKFCIKQFTG